MPEIEVTEQDILQLRDLTGVESAEYELDGVAYWTDAQLAEVLLLTAKDDDLDRNAAAAYVLEAWAAQLARAYDVSMDGQSLARSQMMAAVQARADELRLRAGLEGMRSIQTEAPESKPPRTYRPTRAFYRRRWKGNPYR